MKQDKVIITKQGDEQSGSYKQGDTTITEFEYDEPIPYPSPENRRLDSKYIQQIRNFTMTEETRASKAIVSALKAGGGDFTDIQSAIDFVNARGGGTVFIRGGTYVLTSSLTIYSKVALVGEALGAVILVLSGAVKVQGTGTSIYETGTVAVTKGSTTVTGTGTTWTGNITTSHKIILNGEIFSIASIDSNTQITLSTKYFKGTLSGLTYTAAVFVEGVFLQNLVISGGNGNQVDLDHLNGFALQNVICTGAGAKAFELSDCVNFNLLSITGNQATTNGLYMEDSFNFLMQSSSFTTSATDGIKLLRCQSGSLQVSSSENSTNDGLDMETCSNITCVGLELDENGGNGAFINDCDSINFIGGGSDANTSDGIELDADSNQCNVSSWQANSNTGYGVRINSANCDDNNVIGNQLQNNTAGGVLDSGTTSIVANNQT